MSDPDFRPEAFLVDLDGVLVHSHGLHLRAYERAFGRHGLQMDEGIRSRIVGGVGRQAVLEFAGVEGHRARAVSEAKESAFLELMRQGRLKTAPGAEAFLGLLEGTGAPVVVVSNSATARECLQAMGWRRRLAGVVEAGDVRHLKPHPEPYRMGAELADVSPDRCLAFEDSSAGAASARSAGCWVVGVGPGVDPGEVDHWGRELDALPLRRWLDLPPPVSAEAGVPGDGDRGAG